MKTLKAITIGGETLITIIENEEMYTMTMQKIVTIKSIRLLDVGTQLEVNDHTYFSAVGAMKAYLLYNY
ncbi:hypothetical protein, partial [Francisella tularensis]|uniref:hypothetical protein n=1 Tax=Francisella tularensis TaxID=263 RepID=UPI00199E221F|nr:carbohydrate kinase family protein [Francisella tularensis]